MSCLFWVLMLASFGTVVATGLSNQLMLFKKDPGVLHQSPNSTTVTCSDGSCSVFECTRACMERGDCVVYSHSPAAGLCVLGGPVHANTSTVDVVDDAWDTYKRRKQLRLSVKCLLPVLSVCLPVCLFRGIWDCVSTHLLSFLRLFFFFWLLFVCLFVVVVFLLLLFLLLLFSLLSVSVFLCF